MAELARVAARLEALTTKTCPFPNPPKAIAKAHWVKPKMAVEVQFTEMTEDGMLRHPVYLGERDDVRATPSRSTESAGDDPLAALIARLHALEDARRDGELTLPGHQFNSAKNNGRNFNSHRSRYLCSNCHTPEVVGQKETTWMAPDAKLDYTGFDARSTCEVVKRNLGNDSKRMREHLLHDGRIRCAIESGMTPSRQKAAVPGGYAEWERDVLAWINGGMRCE